MMLKQIVIAGRFCVVCEYDKTTLALEKVFDEYCHILSPTNNGLPTVGLLRVDDDLSLPSGALELKKNILYEKGNALFVCDRQSSVLKIEATEREFTVTLSSNANPDIAFYTLETLIRFYAPSYGLAFLHTGAFIWHGKVITISAFGGVGKTEVMLYALERGAQFLADDFAIFNNQGEIFPYTKKIYLCEYPYTDVMLRRLHKRKCIYRVKTYCQKHPGRFSSHLADWLESRYFGVKIDYTDVASSETPLKFYHVDNFFWVDSSDKTGSNQVSSQTFVQKMSLCLSIESRRYFDYEGYLRLKYPFIDKIISCQYDVLSSIAANVQVQGLTVRERQFDELAEYVLAY